MTLANSTDGDREVQRTLRMTPLHVAAANCEGADGLRATLAVAGNPDVRDFLDRTPLHWRRLTTKTPPYSGHSWRPEPTPMREIP